MIATALSPIVGPVDVHAATLEQARELALSVTPEDIAIVARFLATPAARAAEAAIEDARGDRAVALVLLATPHSRTWHEALKADRRAWAALAFVGRGAGLEYRDCACGTTLAIWRR